MPNQKAKTKKKGPTQPWSMYPVLHDQVLDLLDDEGLSFDFHRNDESRTKIRDYDTNVMGRFRCYNKACDSDGWSSKKIAITIRMYPGNRYNARVYHQRCQSCNRISRPFLDDSYAERVAYRLKKWSGVEVETPYYAGQSDRPHQRSLCEGCRDGHCTESLRS